LNQLEEKNAGTAEDLVDYVLKDFCFWILPSDREDERCSKVIFAEFRERGHQSVLHYKFKISHFLMKYLGPTSTIALCRSIFLAQLQGFQKRRLVAVGKLSLQFKASLKEWRNVFRFRVDQI
jgi:hypothetical protein